MRVLIIGTSTNPKSHTAGFNIGYMEGFTSLGHNTVSISHRLIETHTGTDYDLILLRDTTVNIDAMIDLSFRGEHFAVFTHAEFNQGKRDIDIIKELDPEIIFLDQPLGGVVFKELSIPSIFLGYGANHRAISSPYKDIDVLWVGHGYPARQQEVVNQVWPLRNLTGYNIKIHGRGQPDGPLSIPDMLDAMSRSKVVIHMGEPIVTGRGGYGGRRIYDALASGCYVVSTRTPLSKQIFPVGVRFCKNEDIRKTVMEVMDTEWEFLQEEVETAMKWVAGGNMIKHKCQAMLEAVGL